MILITQAIHTARTSNYTILIYTIIYYSSIDEWYTILVYYTMIYDST